MLDASADKDQLDKMLSEATRVPDALAKGQFSDGKIRNGQLLDLTDVEGHRKIGMFVQGKLFTVKIARDTLGRITNMDVLLRRGVARLLHILETKWAPTAGMSFLPQRYEHIDTGKVLFSPKSTDNKLEDARLDAPEIDEAFHAE